MREVAQYGVFVPSGADIIVQTLKLMAGMETAIQQHLQEWVLLAVDWANAFNSMSRDRELIRAELVA